MTALYKSIFFFSFFDALINFGIVEMLLAEQSQVKRVHLTNYTKFSATEGQKWCSIIYLSFISWYVYTLYFFLSKQV